MSGHPTTQSKKTPAANKVKAQTSDNKENITALGIDSDGEVERERNGSKPNWSADEKNLAFVFVLGVGDEASRHPCRDPCEETVVVGGIRAEAYSCI
ncbi:hypothetical protein R3P38DRAFT_3235125 [Favolaschia claudopus]|uniref:Uncharacterized protein n=1 Tax=Favolaschia claudopus TaxID=2862362 RepID=A0AAV9ZGB3_9AGAR